MSAGWLGSKPAGRATREVTAHAGFSDQSQSSPITLSASSASRHFKRIVGVTPGQFRTPARIA
jgi:AraC-like DNA-binding protein